MSELEWVQPNYNHPRTHSLYRGNRRVGMVSMLGNTDNIRGYSVYLCEQRVSAGFTNNTFQCVMPTLDEAKLVLQTLAGSQS